MYPCITNFSLEIIIDHTLQNKKQGPCKVIETVFLLEKKNIHYFKSG